MSTMGARTLSAAASLLLAGCMIPVDTVPNGQSAGQNLPGPGPDTGGSMGGAPVGTGGGGGSTATDSGFGADAALDPFLLPARCSSGTMWTGGNRESPLMQPGEPCVECHTRMREGPRLAIAGTVYPSGHEPSQCNGVDGTRGGARPQVVVTDVSGRSFTANVNAAGNFYLESGNLTPPLKAKVVLNGRERLMVTPAPTGDCNGCHSQAGATTVAAGAKAPGRIVLP